MRSLNIPLLVAGMSLLAACAPARVVAPPEAHPYDKSMAPFLQALELRQGAQHGAVSLEEMINRGDEARAAGDTDGALLSYLEGHKIAPKDTRVLLRLGRLHRDRQEPQLAEQALRWTMELDPQAAEARVVLGLAKLDQRDRAAAEQLLEEALQLDPDRWEAHDGLGVMADLRGDHGAAQSHYEAALKIAQSPVVLNNLGYSYYMAGDLERARGLFEQALAANPAFHRAQYNLGLVTAKQGNYTEAIAIFSKVMKPDAAYNNVGYLCMMAGKYDEAEEFFRKAIEMSPTYNATANDNLKTLQRMRGN